MESRLPSSCPPASLEAAAALLLLPLLLLLLLLLPLLPPPLPALLRTKKSLSFARHASYCTTRAASASL